MENDPKPHKERGRLRRGMKQALVAASRSSDDFGDAVRRMRKRLRRRIRMGRKHRRGWA